MLNGLLKRRTLVAAAVLGVVAALAIPVAFADSPHFVSGPNYTATFSSLEASGKAAGLGNSPLNAFLTADAVNEYYHCTNHGNNFAPGHPATVSPAVGPVEPITPHNGQITFDAFLPAPTPPSAASACPNKNWHVVVDEVDYLGVVLHIQDSTGTDLLTDGPNDFSTCASFSGAGGQCQFTG